MLSDVARVAGDAPDVLLVEDDAEIARLLGDHLAGEGMRVRITGDAQAMDTAIAERRPDVVLLDAMLPGEDGFSACLRLTAGGQPVIMVTAMGAEADRIRGLDLGADDYVAKPFSPGETVARIRAVLRRSARKQAVAPERSVLSFEGWTVDPVAREVRDPDGTLISMFGAEFDILVALCSNPGEILSRGRLLELTHAGGAGPDERSVDVHVSRLRQRIEADPREPILVKTVRLAGYVFTAPVTVS